MVRIAVTGATGMIGSELIRLVLEEGHSVIAIIRPRSARIDNIPKSDKVTIIESDISGYNKITAEENCDIFYHLAWKEVFGPERDNVFTQTDNIVYSLDAAKLSKKWGAKVFVGAGSQAEFGPTNQVLGNMTPTNPESGYGVAKYAAGKLCKLFCEQNDIRFNWGRITSTYGERDTSSTLIMYLINTFLDGKSPELTKCEQIWDYTYSKDLANALFLIGIKGKGGKTYVIGSGEHRSLKDYVKTLRDSIDPKIQIKFGVKQYYAHQPMFLCPDISELRKDTGYEPKYDFETGIVNVIDYVRKNRTR